MKRREEEEGGGGGEEEARRKGGGGERDKGRTIRGREREREKGEQTTITGGSGDVNNWTVWGETETH